MNFDVTLDLTQCIQDIISRSPFLHTLIVVFLYQVLEVPVCVTCTELASADGSHVTCSAVLCSRWLSCPVVQVDTFPEPQGGKRSVSGATCVGWVRTTNRPKSLLKQP